MLAALRVVIAGPRLGLQLHQALGGEGTAQGAGVPPLLQLSLQEAPLLLADPVTPRPDGARGSSHAFIITRASRTAILPDGDGSPVNAANG